MPYYVYIIQTLIDGTYYVGSTQNVDERVTRHNQRRSKYTKGRGPWELVYTEEFADRSSAMKREKEIKSRKKKEYIESMVRTSRQG